MEDRTTRRPRGFRGAFSFSGQAADLLRSSILSIFHLVLLRRRPPLCILQGLPPVVDLRRLLERLEEEANPLLAKRPCELVALRRPLGDPLHRVGSGPLV